MKANKHNRNGQGKSKGKALAACRGMAAGTWYCQAKEAADRITEVGASAFLVYCVLCRHANADGESFPGGTTLGKKTGLTMRSVWRAIKTLEEAGWITVERSEQTQGKRPPNVYRLLPLPPSDTRVTTDAPDTSDTADTNDTGGNVTNDTSVTSDTRDLSLVTPEHLEQDKANKKKARALQKPSLEEIQGYCRERGNGVDPEHFLAYYESNGWRVGRNPMKDWRATIRTWERNGLSNGNGKPASRVPTDEDLKNYRPGQ